MTFSILADSGLLAGLDAADKRTFRKLCVSAILHTDMAVHKRLVDSINANPLLRPKESMEDRSLLVSLLLHCADLHTPTLEPETSRRIADALGEEFSEQAERERALGIPVSVMHAETQEGKCQMEIGFISFVVRPLFQTLAKVEPELGEFVTRVVRLLAEEETESFKHS